MSSDTQLPDPTGGGRYERRKDGSLVQTHRTDEAPMPGAPAPTDTPTNTNAGGIADTKE